VIPVRNIPVFKPDEESFSREREMVTSHGVSRRMCLSDRAERKEGILVNMKGFDFRRNEFIRYDNCPRGARLGCLSDSMSSRALNEQRTL